jgi:hypothetical protein
MLKIGVLKIELLKLGKTDLQKAKFFPCFRDSTWAKILGFLLIKRKYFFKLHKFKVSAFYSAKANFIGFFNKLANRNWLLLIVSLN